jgi:hypothetical protein
MDLTVSLSPLRRGKCPAALIHRALTFRADVGGALVNRDPLELIATAGTIAVFSAMWQKPTSGSPIRIGFISYCVTEDHYFVDLI